MKKFVVLFFCLCIMAGMSSCAKMCKCSFLKNGSPLENTTEFEKELDNAYKDCSAMSNFDEETQTGTQCK